MVHSKNHKAEFFGIFLIISYCLGTVSACSLSGNEDWKDVVAGKLYYDATSLKKTLVGYQAILKIYAVKNTYIQGKIGQGLPVKGYENYSFTILYCGVNCDEQKFYISRIDDYNTKGEKLFSSYVGKKRGGRPGRPNYDIIWQPLSEGSEIGIIYFF